MILDGSAWWKGEMITGKQAKAAREALGWSRPRLSARAAVSDLTIKRFEEGHRPAIRKIVAIERALEAAGIEFLEFEPGARMRQEG